MLASFCTLVWCYTFPLHLLHRDSVLILPTTLNRYHRHLSSVLHRDSVQHRNHASVCPFVCPSLSKPKTYISWLHFLVTFPGYTSWLQLKGVGDVAYKQLSLFYSLPLSVQALTIGANLTTFRRTATSYLTSFPGRFNELNRPFGRLTLTS